jgi:hypothetical protein
VWRVRRSVATAAKTAQVHVLDADRRERRRECALAEMRMAARSGRGPHIGERRDLGGPQ